MARTQTLGSLIIDLRSDSSQFIASVDGAKKSLGGVETSAKKSQRELSRFAAEGLGAVIPGAAGAEMAIGRLIGKLTAMGGAFAMLGQATLLVGGILAVAAAVQRLEEEWRNFLNLGETTKQTLDRINKELKDEKDNLDKLAKARSTLNALDKEIALAQGDTLTALRLETQERLAQVDATTTGANRIAARAKVEELAALKRKALDDEWANKVLEDIQKEHEARVKALTIETQTLAAELQKRQTIRDSFVAGIGTGGLGGESITTAFRTVSDFNTQYQTDLKQIAFLEQQGKITAQDALDARMAKDQQAVATLDTLKATYQDIPGALNLIDNATKQLQAGGFGTLWQEADTWVRANIDSIDALEQRQAALQAKLGELATAAGINDDAVRSLTQSYTNLSASVWESIRAFQTWQNTVAAGGG